MRILGLTGSIGSGKSTVAKLFRSLGAQVIDADSIVTGLYLKDKALVKKISKSFGASALTTRGAIDRRSLAALAFASRANLKRLNRIVHPAVVREIKSELKKIKKIKSAKRKPKLAVIDAPLLFEAGLQQLCDVVAVVAAPRKTQIARAMRSGHLSRRECLLRLSSQMPQGKTVKLADCIIDNRSSLAALKPKVKALYKKLSG